MPSFLDLLGASKLHGRVGKVSVEKAAIVLVSGNDIATAATATALDTFAVMLTTAVMRMVGTVHKVAGGCIRQPFRAFELVMGAVHIHLHKRRHLNILGRVVTLHSKPQKVGNRINLTTGAGIPYTLLN